ncbi:diiron oxygenase [Streptomyces sp. I05A-00742]|uniref:AurF N-oxygenase family protein n=1 Tax=Streptomyces sp. I05A-00742 TaxID=2732853 RepID=UPI00148848AF|nr:diiron oxygenase [Streptomyces sp. I05A-00742]
MPDRPLSTRQRDPEAVAARLLRASERPTAETDADIDWTTPPLEDTWFLPPERLSLYGTPLWHGMDRAQRIALSREEWARAAAAGVWFERFLIKSISRYVADRDVTDVRTHYAMTEMGDETRHIVMFGRAVSWAGCRDHGPDPWLRRAAPLALVLHDDVTTFATALLAEEILDRLQREMAGDERVQPLVRQISRIHVREEARHVSFARTELLHALERVPAPRLALDRQVVGLSVSLVMNNICRPTTYRAIGLDPRRAVREAARNPHHRETRLWVGEKLVAFLTEAGLITRAEHPWWRRAGLMR